MCVPRVAGFMILGSCRDRMTQGPDYPLVVQLRSAPLIVKSKDADFNDPLKTPQC